MADSSPQPYIGFARRYRSQQFSELVGQDQIAHSLTQQVEQNRVAQAYLFSGPRGVGKTSAARILAKSLNCEHGPTASPCGKCEQCVSITSGSSMDVIEIDAASSRKIDDIRDLQESISQHTFAARKKVYIVDEVHMLTNEAFNALLKTLEEPPSFVVFILATTELEKVPETIKSRCQVFQFNRISLEDLIRHLDYVSEKEQIQMDPGERRAILETIALAVDGGMRDAVMSLDQLRALGDGSIRLDDTARFLGVVEHDLLIRTVELLQKRDTKALLEMVNYLVERGRDLERYVKNLLSFLRDLMILKSGGGKELVNLSTEKLERAKGMLWTVDESGRRAEAISYPTLLNYLQIFLGLEEQIKEAVQVRIHLEFAFVKLTAIEPVMEIADLIDRLENQAASASTRPVPAPPQAASVVSQPAPAPFEREAEPLPKPSTPDIFVPSASSVALAPKAAPPAPAKRKVSGDDAAAVWNAVLANRERLGVALSLALNDCRCLGLSENTLKIGIPRNSLAAPAMQAPDKRAKLESYIHEITGQPIRVEIQLLSDSGSSGSGPSGPVKMRMVEDPTPSMFNSSNALLQPVLQRGPSPEEDDPTDSDSADTQSLYLDQNPDAKIRAALQKNTDLRTQVEMVQRFFDGKVLDANGREIVL